jgi:hypothetical protein
MSPVERKRRPGLLRMAGGLERRPKLTVNCVITSNSSACSLLYLVWMKNNGFANINPVGLIMRAICDCFRLKTKKRAVDHSTNDRREVIGNIYPRNKVPGALVISQPAVRHSPRNT